MEKFKTISPVYLYGGFIGLDDSQARPRLETGRIKKTDADGVYEIAGEVCFKVGEVICLESPGLAMLQKLESLDPPVVDDSAEMAAKKSGRPKK